jgi:hypothetical protein
MKRLIVAFVLFSAVPIFADSFKADIFALNFDTINNSAGLTIFIHGVSDGHPGGHLLSGSATNVDVLSLTCANACTDFNATVAFSGLTMNNVIFNVRLFSTVFVDGTLNLNAKFVSSLPFDLGQLTGTFRACLDPACRTPLFSLFTKNTGKAFLNVSKNAGALTLTGGSFAVPEPSTVALFGTGCLFLIGLALDKCKRKAVCAC